MLFEPNDQGLILGKNPVTIGHEATGVVVQPGSGELASKFKEGDPVGFICAVECCFECTQCKTVHNAWCETGKTKMQGFTLDGYFQEYVVVDAREAMVLPQGLDPKTAAPLFCAGVTAYHGVEDCELKPGQWMAIVGCGGLGHLGIQYAKAMGLKVIGLDIAEGALEEAKKCGADHVFNSMTDKEWQKKVIEITGGGVDAAVNFTASKKSYDDCPAILKPGLGTLMVVGIPRQPLEINALDVALGRFKVKGSNNGSKFARIAPSISTADSVIACYNMRPAIEFSAKHNIQPHLTQYKLEDVPKMIELMVSYISIHTSISHRLTRGQNSHKATGRMGVVFD
jgi:propanol-preferring alcohol dehydrogenase